MTSFPLQPDAPPDVVTGVQLTQGIGAPKVQDFWVDAWAQVLRRKGAVLAIGWVGLVVLLAIFAPLIANGHPLVLRELDAQGHVVRTTSPLLTNLGAVDWVMLALGFLGVPWLFIGRAELRGRRLALLTLALIQALATVSFISIVESFASQREPLSWVAWVRSLTHPGLIVSAIVSAAVFGLVLVSGLGLAMSRRLKVGLLSAIIAFGAGAAAWGRPIERFDYTQREAAGKISATYTLIPWSPSQRYSELNRREPLSTLGQGLDLKEGTPGAKRLFILGTDAFGQDVLSQMLCACRLSISIGLVSTGIAVLIGVTLGALMGYFGGWVDLALYRLVEVFLAIPVLFLLIVAVAVLPDEFRSTYVVMAIIGCVSWTGAARFTRAEFLKLRNQDFVQSARAVGLPLRSILFKHMLPNGVTPVLVDASFGIAAAILAEATLSFLGLGPVDQPSWGKLLSSATNAEGEFKWWLAIFPGAAIFLTVLAYNVIGEALRDAIDPKLKKARV